MTRLRGAFAALVLASGVLAAAPALAAPELEVAEQTLTRLRRLDLTLDCTLDTPGSVTVAGTVNGRPFTRRVRVRKAGTRRVKVKVDARRAHVRKLTEPLRFELTATAEDAAGARVDVPVTETARVPVVLLPGLGNQPDDAGLLAFAGALAVASGGEYALGGPDTTLVRVSYDSLGSPLQKSAKLLDRAVAARLRGSAFAKADVVGYSMGGLVARRWLADGGARRARRVLFLATPNEGAPVAQILSIGLQTDILGTLLDQLPTDAPEVAALLDALASVPDTDGAVDVLRNFYPTYTWAFLTVPGLGGSTRIGLTPQLIRQFGSLVPGLAALPLDFDSPLTALNAKAPPDGPEFYALGYTELPAGGFGAGIGTVDEVDVTPLVSGGNVDPAALATGDGDGVVPWRSVRMADVPAWRDRITSTDLGAGSHVTLLADPFAIARVLEILGAAE